MPQRPLKEVYISFRTDDAKKALFEQNADKFAKYLEETKDVEADPSKILRRLNNAFNNAITDKTWPAWPFKLYTDPRGEPPSPGPQEPKRKPPSKRSK